jgi:hypothetical protein
VRTWIIAVVLCIFWLILPLQCFVIGDDLAFGVQGTIFRYQMYSAGNSLIPLNHEINFISSGVYNGRTAVSVILWVLGTILFTLTTICALGYWNRLPHEYLQYIIAGISGAGILYLASCVTQYGPLLHGSAGVSMPFGIVILFLFTVFLYIYQDFLYSEESVSDYFSGDNQIH